MQLQDETCVHFRNVSEPFVPDRENVMTKLLKIIFSMVAVVVLLVVVLAIALPLVVDPNDYKTEIEEAVKNYTGRTFTITGDLELSVFPWLGLSTGRLSLSNPPSFDDTPFIEIEEADVKVKVLPLLSKKIEVSSILLKGFSLVFEKNRQGISNWGKLAGADKAAGRVGGSFLAALTVGDLSLENAQIIWNDRQTGRLIEIKNFNLNADRLVFNEPVGISLAFSVNNIQPAFTQEVDLTTDLMVDHSLDRIELHKTKVEFLTEGEDFPLRQLAAKLTADIVFNRKLNRIESDFRLNSGDLNIKAEIKGRELDTKPLFTGPVAVDEFNARKWMQELQLDISSLQDATSLERVALKLDLTATSDTTKLDKIELQVDESVATGMVSIKNFDPPVIRFDLDVDTVDVDRYLPAKEPVDMQADPNKRMPSAATPSVAVLEGARLLPLETLRSLDAEGSVSIGLLKFNNMKLEEVDLKLNAKDGIVQSRQAARKLYQGSYTGDIKMNYQNQIPEMQLSEQLTNIEVESLLADLQGDATMTGHVSGTAKLNGRGHTRSELKSSLNGEIVFVFTDGIVRGFNLEQIIENGKSILTGSTKPRISEQDLTEYSQIKGTLKLANGMASNDDFMAHSPSLRVNGNGTADLPSGKLDYKVTAKVVRSESVETEPAESDGIPMVIDVGGTFKKPSYTLMINEMIPEKEKQEYLDKIEKKFGSDVKDMLKQWF